MNCQVVWLFFHFLIFFFVISGAQSNGGPSAEELIRLLDQCDLSNSHCSTPCISPCPSLLGPAARIKASNMAFLNQSIVQQTEPTQNANSTNASAPPSNSVNNSSNNNNAPSSSSSSSNPLFWLRSCIGKNDDWHFHYPLFYVSCFHRVPRNSKALIDTLNFIVVDFLFSFWTYDS